MFSFYFYFIVEPHHYFMETLYSTLRLKELDRTIYHAIDVLCVYTSMVDACVKTYTNYLT